MKETVAAIGDADEQQQPQQPQPRQTASKRSSVFAPRPSLPVATGNVVGRGVFRKKGANVKSWKLRKFAITEDGVLTYTEMGNEVPKGAFSARSVRLTSGPSENVSASGADKAETDETVRAGGAPVAINMEIAGASRLMELVFDSEADAISFVKMLAAMSIDSNIAVRCICCL